MPVYQPNIPTGTVNLDEDFINLRNNFQQLDISFGQDHVTFSDTSSNNGYHKVIHMVANSTIAGKLPDNQPIIPPPTVNLTGELFTAQINDGVAADVALYYQMPGPPARLVQLTRNFQPNVNISGNGCTFLPGGFILQWGTISATSSNPSVVFASSAPANFTFPFNLFNVQVTRQHATSSPGTNSMWVSTMGLSTAGFTIVNDDGHTWSYNWLALGN